MSCTNDKIRRQSLRALTNEDEPEICSANRSKDAGVSAVPGRGREGHNAPIDCKRTARACCPRTDKTSLNIKIVVEAGGMIESCRYVRKIVHQRNAARCLQLLTRCSVIVKQDVQTVRVKCERGRVCQSVSCSIWNFTCCDKSERQPRHKFVQRCLVLVEEDDALSARRASEMEEKSPPAPNSFVSR